MDVQLVYVVLDVFYLYVLKEKFEDMFVWEECSYIVEVCFGFFVIWVELDFKGWDEIDIFVYF